MNGLFALVSPKLHVKPRNIEYMSTGYLTPRTGLVVALALFAGCDSDVPQEAPRDLLLNIWVVDESGQPVPHVALSGFFWFATDTMFTRSFLVGNDSSGLATLAIPLTDGLVPDSLRIGALPSDCTALGFQETKVAVPPDASPLTVRVTLPTVASAAVVQPGESCGVGRAEWVPGVTTDYWVSLHIDSITSHVYGRWQIAYRETRRHDFGSFVGSFTPGALGLQLIPDPGFAICQPRYRLLASVSAGDTIETAYLQEDGGCPIYDNPFRLYAQDTPYFP